MRLFLVTAGLAALTACGGSEPAADKPAEKPAAAEKEAEAKKEEPKKEEAPPAEEKKEEAGEPDLASMSDDEKKAYLVDLGKKVYETGGSGGLACVTCHQANGEGMPPSFPPLKGQEEWMGDCGKHAGYVINGLQGEIEVDGVTYNGVMPAQGNLSDLEIAAVITYERNAWGNDYGICTPDQVAAAR